MRSEKRILLIDWVGEKWDPGNYTKHSCLEPYGLECIGSFAQKFGFSVKILQFRYEPLKRIIKIIESENPFLIGLSVKTYNFFNSLDLARAIKEVNKNIYIVFGGDHPSLCPGIVREGYIDFVVHGEGEISFTDLLKAISDGDDVNKINNLAFWDGEKIIITPRNRIKNVDLLPFALRDKDILMNCKQYALSSPAPSQQKSVAQVNFSRGCSFNCSFCASPQLWNRLVTYRSPKNVVEEIAILKEKFGTNLFFFSDLTFNSNISKIRELCEEIIRFDLRINWFCMCKPEGIDKEIFQLMNEAGCSKIGFGIESLNETSLRKLKPKQRIKITEIQELMNWTNSLGIINRAYLMIGYPWESIKDIENTFEALKKLAVDELKVSFLTPFPGTSIYQEYRHLLLTNDTSCFTTDEPVIRVKHIEFQQMISLRRIMVERFYKSKEYEKRVKEKVKKYPNLKQSFDEFFSFLRTRTIIS